jgi:hypothetical protein
VEAEVENLVFPKSSTLLYFESRNNCNDSMVYGLELFFYLFVILQVSQFKLKITWALFNIKEKRTAQRFNFVLYFLARGPRGSVVG